MVVSAQTDRMPKAELRLSTPKQRLGEQQKNAVLLYSAVPASATLFEMVGFSNPRPKRHRRHFRHEHPRPLSP